jgi:hypothetical protein
MKSNIFIKTKPLHPTKYTIEDYQNVDKCSQDLFITINIKDTYLPSQSHSYEVYISIGLKKLTSIPFHSNPTFPTLQKANQYVTEYLKTNNFKLIDNPNLLCYL